MNPPITQQQSKPCNEVKVQTQSAEWELVNEAAPTGTLNEMIDDLVKLVDTPNGAPICIFMPLVNAVLAKQHRLYGDAV